MPSEKDGYAEGMERPRTTWRVRVIDCRTEAEWEFACRAGMSTVIVSATQWRCCPSYGTFAGRSPGPTAVGLFKPNDCGLFDVHGNVWEWCDEFAHDYPAGTQRSLPRDLRTGSGGFPTGIALTVRGGAYNAPQDNCVLPIVAKYFPTTRLENLGFRVVRTYRQSVVPRPVRSIHC